MANKKTSSKTKTVTKKSQSVPKTSSNSKTPARTSKTSKTAATKTAKNLAKSKPSNKIHPFSPVFGWILILVGAIIFAFILALAVVELVKPGGVLSKKPTEPDSVLIAREYEKLDENNIFVYKSQAEILNILEHGSGVIFLGFPSCPWCQAYVPMLDQLARDNGLKEIYYYNIEQDRANNTEFYQKVKSLLSDYLQYDNVGEKRIYVPNATFVINGTIIGNDWETSKDTLNLQTPEEYWTEERIEAWQAKLQPYFNQLKEAGVCGDVCNK